MRIAKTNDKAYEALDWLRNGGRNVELTDSFEWIDAESTGRLWEPNLFLQNWLDSRPPGKAVDLGCGTGREVTFLADLGWKVGAVDHLGEALETAKVLAARYSTSSNVSWHLEEAETFKEFADVDLVLMLFSYSLCTLENVFERAPTKANILIETFTETHFSRFGKPSPNRLVTESSMRENLPEGRTLIYEEAWRDSGKHTARIQIGAA